MSNIKNYDILNDISILTSIPKSDLTNLSDLCEDDMCHCLLEQLNSENDCVSFDIGIGLISIKMNNEEDTLQYKFIPSQQFECKLIKSVNNNSSPIVERSEQALSKRVLNIYKELL